MFSCRKEESWNSVDLYLQHLLVDLEIIDRSSRLEVFCEKGFLFRNFTKLTGKHLCQCLFFNKEASACNFMKKETLPQVFSCKFYETPFFIEHFWWLLLNWSFELVINSIITEAVVRRCCVKKVFLETSQFTRRHLCQSLFFNKVPGWVQQLY